MSLWRCASISASNTWGSRFECHFLQFLPTEYVVRERKVIVSLCLSVHTCGGGGGYPDQVQPAGGDTLTGGVPHLGYPHPIGPGWGGVSRQGGGTPPQVPPIRPGEEVPKVGYPPRQTWPGGGTPRGGYSTSYRITDGVLDTRRSVCLLRSRRRTFLFL